VSTSPPGSPAPSALPAALPTGRHRRWSWALLLLWGTVFTLFVDRTRTWGWDEAMHAELPAARVALALRAGEPLTALRALHDCQQYPFVWPAVLGLLQAGTGLSEGVARGAGRVAFALTLACLFGVAWRVAARAGSRSPPVAAWSATALAALSPLAVAYSGTLFLEVPFLLAAAMALRAWLDRDGRHSRELLAGLWLAVCFFTKFNYGLLLGFALFLDLLRQGALALRAGGGRAFLSRACWLGAPVLASWLWWFVLPWPAGADMAASHRDAFAHFLGGNRDASMHTAAGLRAVDWGCFLVPSPRWLIVLAAGLVAGLVAGRRSAATWTVALVLVATAVPIALHPFHLDRFLLPIALPLWVLAGCGLAALLPAAPRARLALGALALPLLFLWPRVDGLAWLRLAGHGGDGDPEGDRYRRAALASRRDLWPDRALETNGLRTAEAQALIELVGAELSAADRVGWVGMSQTFPPAALLVGLVQRGGEAGRAAEAQLRRGELQRSFVEIGYTDPGWSEAQLLEWSAEFTAILATRPVDLGLNPAREFMTRYQALLAERGIWRPRQLGTVPIQRPHRAPVPFDLYVFRRAT
jgi:hypothetical protein